MPIRILRNCGWPERHWYRSVYCHEEQRVFPYTAEQLYDLVSDVERYPDFLPWCITARLAARNNLATYADLVVGFRMIRERFGSRIVGVRPGSIDVTQTSGPFHCLSNSWHFHDLDDGGCRVELDVEFEFRSRVLNALVGALLHEAVRCMVGAFEDRAKALYGNGTEASMATACSTVESRTA